MPGKKNDSHDADRPEETFTEEELKNMVYDARKDPAGLSSQVTVQVDENGRNHLVVDLGYLTAIDGNILQNFQETFQKQRKEILDRISAEPPEKVHKDFLADHGEEDNYLDLAVYWYRDCSVQFELHNYQGALDWIIPAEELDRIQLPLAERIDSHRSDFPDRDMTLADLLTTWTPDGGSRESLLDQILKEIGKADLVPVKSISVHDPDGQYIPSDVLNQEFWKLAAEDMTGKKLFVKGTQKGQIDYSAVFDPEYLEEIGAELSITLDPYGERLYEVCDTLIENGDMDVTATTIYHRMGVSSKSGCNQKDRNKVLKELKKQRHVELTIDNQKEADTSKYTHYKYSGALLPSEYIEEVATTKGGTTEGYIHFLRDHLPLTEFSRGHHYQGATFPPNVYQTPNRLDNRPIAIENRILFRIAGAKNGSISPDILYEDIYDAAELPEDADRKIKARCVKYAERALDFWKDPNGCQIIADYKTFQKGDKYTGYVVVKDKNGKTVWNKDGTPKKQKKVMTHQGPGIHLVLLTPKAVEEDQKDPEALPDKDTATDSGK